MLSSVAIELLDQHPQNPRLSARADVVAGMVAGITEHGELAERYALTVRAIDDRYQVLAGHHRRLAAIEAGLTEVPAFIVEMDDAEAFMELARSNTQGELTALERGMHALGSGMSQRAYAEATGIGVGAIQQWTQAAKVAMACNIDIAESLSSFTTQLSAIHAAPSWLWPALVSRLVTEGWTVEATRAQVKALAAVEQPPTWSDTGAIAEAVVTGAMKPAEVAQMAAAAVCKLEDDLAEKLAADLAAARPSRLSAVLTVVAAVEEEQARRDQERKRREREGLAAAERAAERTRRLRESVSLDQWAELSHEERDHLLSLDRSLVGTVPSFNKQENESIEWAQWSWNPVTGCRHDCSYCYARDIAQSKRMATVYPNGFEPTFRPRMLLAPASMKVPTEASRDTRYRNVFTCSMADLFGRWVPEEWIKSVLGTVERSPQWNFLMLTKFPKRMAEFEIPDNAWMGTTVDLQARVANAEAAFQRVTAGVRWLSVEPMLEPLRFKRLDLFQWVVIGGSSASSMTPDWRPPFEWVVDLVKQCREAGAKVYFKTNLLGSRLLELPFDAPIKADPVAAPAVFHYLGKAAGTG